MRLFNDDTYWIKVNDGNRIALSIFKRHYSFRRWRQRKGKNGTRIVGPGESIILIGKNNDALFVWRKEKYRKDGQTGINCSIFRNESEVLSSVLLGQAEKIAADRWPQERLYTFVNPKKIKSTNPGYCFKVNGWRQCGVTITKKMIVLEKLSNEQNVQVSDTTKLIVK